uniref:Uncharacterized protein n=1 Tax=Hordeum vulgare subsp. vulgare TaxID=112509 RepID=A0A287Q3W7_HORVV
MSEKDEKIKSLRGMGFSEDEAKMTILICGVDADISVLVDSITASQVEEACHSRNLSDRQVTARCFDSFGGRKRARLTEESKKRRRRYGGGAQGNRPSLDGSDEEPMPLPNPMIGFNLPGWGLSMTRVLPELAIGPPYFYYENVARAPKGVWAKISRFLFDIQPEFVDSLHLCAAARKRGYIHNLPTENRSPILPLPPKTIFEAFPHYKKWWPSWDQRTHLNCLQTCMASAKEAERIQQALSSSGNPPPQSVQKYVRRQCSKWNLVWIGKHKVAPLEPHEIEYLLGFPKDRSHERLRQNTEIQVSWELIPSRYSRLSLVSAEGHVSQWCLCAILVHWYWRRRGCLAQAWDSHEGSSFC